MAQIQSSDEAPKRKFAKVKKSANVTVARRKPSFGVLEPTGILKLGTQASEYYLEVIRNSGYDRTNCISTFGADVPTDMVAAYASPHGTEGGSAFRLNPGKRARIPQVTLYLHGVFDEYPTFARKAGAGSPASPMWTTRASPIC